MSRAYYFADAASFVEGDVNSILGQLTKSHEFALDDKQRNSWIKQIEILKPIMKELERATIAFEFSIPRMGKRVDVVILYLGVIFLLEFKVGEKKYPKHALVQVEDYALDLKNFHEMSHALPIVPVLVSTKAPFRTLELIKYDDSVFVPICVNEDNLISVLKHSTKQIDSKTELNPIKWLNSIYKPTPTIVEAAQALYQGHNVHDISRSDSGAENLTVTADIISYVIERSKRNSEKSICFITGVPGAGKTLAGLNVAVERHNVDKDEHSVFLSGNGPLVTVLREALARDEVQAKKGTKDSLTLAKARSKTQVFIQNIHHFRDDNLKDMNVAPVERVVVFDEAQRAWDKNKVEKFMRDRGHADFDMSEPEYLISVMDRHNDWAVVVCLVGGGQEINTGEAGLPEWFKAVHNRYSHWNVYASHKLTDFEYTNGADIYSLIPEKQLSVHEELHLSVSVRSYRSEKVSDFVKALLDLNRDNAKQLYKTIQKTYPIHITRSLTLAKEWLNSKVRGSERTGIIASSRAFRLKPYGIHMKAKVERPELWFLEDSNDIRSSCFLEDVASEYEVQGLELDWTCVAWDANLRLNEMSWDFKNFHGARWKNLNQEVQQRYLLNSYRVLLTRARQGMVLFIPEGDPMDETRLPEFYDPLYDYLREIGLEEIASS